MINMNLNEILKEIKGKTVIKSTTGGGAGSILKIELNSNCYFFVYCAWRIEFNDVVQSTSEDDGEALIGRMAKSAKFLENKKIILISISKQNDLTIYFESNYSLKIFCNISYSETENGGTYDTNWELCLPEYDLVFKVNNHFTIETEKYY